MAAFTVLDQVEEDKLHATRLLGIEERPYKRVTKRLLAPNTPIHAFLARAGAPDDNAPEAADAALDDAQFRMDLARFREDVILDFAAFKSSIARIQFLRAANARERERYVAERAKIEQTAREVRDNAARLRVQLDEAQTTLAIRKTYDVLAEKITKNPALKPRDEQHVNIEKLKAAIEELQRESQEHSQAWRERREQLDKVAGEAARLRRVIRDEKEPEAEDKDEDPEGDGDGERDHDPGDEDHLLGVGRRDMEGLLSSTAGTPRPLDDADAATPDGLTAGRGLGPGGSAALTPRSMVPEGGEATPRPDEDVVMEGGEGMEGDHTEPVAGRTEDTMDTT